MDNEYLLICLKRDPNNVKLNHIMNGTVFEQRNALNYRNESQTE